MRTQVGYFGTTLNDPAPHPEGMTGKTSALVYPEIGYTEKVTVADGAPGSNIPTTNFVDIASLTLQPGNWVIKFNLPLDFNYSTGGQAYLQFIVTDNSNTMISAGVIQGGGAGGQLQVYNTVSYLSDTIFVQTTTTFKIRAKRFDLLGTVTTAAVAGFGADQPEASFSARLVG